MSAPVKSKYDRQCVYIGRRLYSGNKTQWVFELLPSRERMAFGYIKGVYIGHTYECTEKSISGKPARVDREREDNAEWESQDALVDIHNEKKRAEKKFASGQKPALKSAVESLHPLVRGLGYFQRQVLVEYLIQQATKVKKK